VQTPEGLLIQLASSFHSLPQNPLTNSTLGGWSGGGDEPELAVHDDTGC
jgi:hypothetical protein